MTAAPAPMRHPTPPPHPAAGPFVMARPRVMPPTLETIPEAVERNIALVRSRTRSRILAVVKADGYGHGAETVARAALAAGAEWLGTTDLDEAVALRSAGLTAPILTWLHATGLDLEVAVTSGMDVAISSLAELESMRAGPRGIRVHLQLDTGMARGGCPGGEWPALLARSAEAHREGAIRVVGIMGHLPSADRADPGLNAPAVNRMRWGARAALRAGLPSPLRHLAATAGALTDPTTHLDLVRIGAGAVGIDPSGTTSLHGAARLTAPVVHTASVPAGTAVGYGSTHVTRSATTLSVLPLGYADGIPRELYSGASVALGGRRYPLVGRVSMDQIVIDTGDIAFPVGSVATVFGPADRVTPSVQEWAVWAGTIPHTIVTGIGPRVHRSVA